MIAIVLVLMIIIILNTITAILVCFVIMTVFGMLLE